MLGLWCFIQIRAVSPHGGRRKVKKGSLRREALGLVYCKRNLWVLTQVGRCGITLHRMQLDFRILEGILSALAKQ